MLCKKCGFDAVAPTAECPQCGAIYAKLDALARQGGAIRAVRVPTEADRQRAREIANDPVEQARLAALASGVGVTVSTLEHVPGRTVVGTYGLVAGQCTVAWGAVFEEVAGLLRNVAGTGRSHRMESAINEARDTALFDLRRAAGQAGMDAVLGVRIQYEEFSGANQRGVLVVVATGTGAALASEPAGR